MTALQWGPAMARPGRWTAALCLVVLLAEGQVSREKKSVARVDPNVFGSVMGEVTLRCKLVPASSNVTKVSWSVMANRDRVLVAVFERGRRPYYPLEQQLGRVAFRSPAPDEDATLIIRSLMVKDGGIYYCTFDIFNRQTEAQTALVVTVTPMNSAHAVAASASTSHPAVVATCTSANGLPPARITWKSDLNFDVNTTETSNTDGTVTVQSRLIMRPSIQAHNQTATCLISSRPGAEEDSIQVLLSISCDASPSFHRTPVWEPTVSVWVCVALLAVMFFVGITIGYSQCLQTKTSLSDEVYPDLWQETRSELCTTKL